MTPRMARYVSAGSIRAPANAKLLYMLLCDSAGKDGSLTIRKKELARTLGMAPGTVSRNMRRLAWGGYIRICPTYHNDGGQSANQYILWRV